MKKSLTNHLLPVRLTSGWLAALAVALIAAVPAFAGPRDMSQKNVVSDVAPPPCDWSGFYLGVNAGVTNFQAKFTDLDYFEGYDTRVIEDTAFIGGGQIGYNLQFGALVLGLEIDGSGTNAKVDTHSNFANTDPLHQFQEDHAKIDFLGTARARMGVAFQNGLVYVTGGGAYATGNWEERYVDPRNTSRNTIWTGDDSRWGWVGGVGIEYMLTCHWTVRAEALYTHLESNTVFGQSQQSSQSGFLDRLSRYQFDDELWTARFGLNYKFGSFFRR